MMIAGRLRRLGLAIILTWGWKRAGIALLAGALSSLAMAPFNAWPILFLFCFFEFVEHLFYFLQFLCRCFIIVKQSKH